MPVYVRLVCMWSWNDMQSMAELAAPSTELLDMLTSLSNDANNIVYIVSGRSRQNLQDWFGHIKNLGLAAEHGYYIRAPMKWHQEKQAMFVRKELESHLRLDTVSHATLTQREQQQLTALYLEDAEAALQVPSQQAAMLLL